MGRSVADTASLSSSPPSSLSMDDTSEKLSRELGVSTALSISEGESDNDGAEDGASTSSSASLGVEDRIVCPLGSDDSD